MKGKGEVGYDNRGARRWVVGEWMMAVAGSENEEDEEEEASEGGSCLEGVLGFCLGAVELRILQQRF
jgi:hypothetical protein